MNPGALGKLYPPGKIILHQGEVGDCMYVILEGEVEVLSNGYDREVSLATLGVNDFFGEMALFDRDVRSATIRARSEVRLLTLDRKTFLRRVQEDPSLAFRVLEKMCHRIRDLDHTLTHLKSGRGSA